MTNFHATPRHAHYHQDALGAERPDLLHLLTDRLLPVLVAALEPLSPHQLAWATGGKEEDVRGVWGLSPLLHNHHRCFWTLGVCACHTRLTT